MQLMMIWSSSGVHGPLTRPGLSTFCHLASGGGGTGGVGFQGASADRLIGFQLLRICDVPRGAGRACGTSVAKGARRAARGGAVVRRHGSRRKRRRESAPVKALNIAAAVAEEFCSDKLPVLWADGSNCSSEPPIFVRGPTRTAQTPAAAALFPGRFVEVVRCLVDGVRHVLVREIGRVAVRAVQHGVAGSRSLHSKVGRPLPRRAEVHARHWHGTGVAVRVPWVTAHVGRELVVVHRAAALYQLIGGETDEWGKGK